MAHTVIQSGRQAIETYYIGPTNHRPARVKAWCQAKSLTISWDHALNASGNHAAACLQLLELLAWDGNWIGGANPNGKGYVFVEVSP